MSITSVETVSGQFVDLAKPDPSTINIYDIAWHLGRICRFIGATKSDLPYTVAQHSVLVLNRVRQTMPVEEQSPPLLLQALLHDAHEYVMGDLPSPAANLLDLNQPIKRLKRRVQKQVYAGLFANKRFGSKRFETYRGPVIDEADKWARSFEAYHLMHSKGRNYYGSMPLDDYLMFRNFVVQTSVQSTESFLDHYNDLISQAD